MKKLIALTLVLMTMLGLAACGESKQPAIIYPNVNGGNVATTPSQPTQPEETLPPAEPTEEDIAALDEYVYIAESLERYDSYNTFGIYADDVYLSGQEAFEYCYKRLGELSTIDKWVGTEHLSQYNYENENINWDREELLSRFAVVEDKWLSYSKYTVDHMGNVSDSRVEYDGVAYYADGKLASLKKENELPGVRHWDTTAPYTGGEIGYREYDEEGKLSKITYYMDENIYLVRTFTYDEEGKVILETAKDNQREKEYTYTYNEDGLLSSITWVGGFWSDSTDYGYSVSYVYDEEGRIARAERKTVHHLNSGYSVTEYINIQEYAYDENGNLTGGTYTQQDWGYRSHGFGTNATYDEYVDYETKDQYTYTLDEEGRVAEVLMIPGAKIYRPGTDKEKVSVKPSYAEIHYTVEYGTYYIYQVNEQ